jgi:diguanylate cyclase (GGDEF)-like protein/PAS domain S-box-containing protein
MFDSFHFLYLSNVSIFGSWEIVVLISFCIILFGIMKAMMRHKRTEQALRKSEYKYRLSAENMRDLIVVIGMDQRIKYASPSYKAVLGISPEEYSGKVSSYLVHPDDVNLLQDAVITVKAEKVPEKIVLRKRNFMTNQYLFFETDILPIFDESGQMKEILAISRDMTQRYLAEKALKESKGKYRLITEYSQDMIRLIDEHGITLYASPSHKANLGFAAEEFIGKHIIDGIHPDDAAYFQKRLFQSMKNRENFKIEVRRQHRNGHWIWVESHGTLVFDESGYLKHIVLTSRNIMDRKQYEENLKNLAFSDPLTGLPNRRSFSHLLEQSIKEAERYQRMLAVLFMDLDKFKCVNDTLGHDAGDELLKQFAKRLKSCLRDSDVIARLGGDEFIILIPEIKDEKDADAVAKKILAVLQEPGEIEGHTLYTTSSIGISLYPRDGEDPRLLIKNADLALYHAKEQGRDSACHVPMG